VAALPPMFLAWPSVEAMARGAAPEAADAKAQFLSALYLAAARFEAEGKAEMPPVATNDSGVQLVAEIVRARIGDPAAREEARKLLRARVEAGQSTAAGATPMAPWMEAWCRAAIGRSYLREDSPEQKRVGLVELLHVPARFATAHPYLAGMALAEASVTLRGLGDTQGADVLARELDTIYPTHPVQDWGPLRSTRAAARAAVPPAAGPAVAPAATTPPAPGNPPTHPPSGEGGP
jgi:hypothetical protein